MSKSNTGWCSASATAPSIRLFSRLPAQYFLDSRLKERELRVLIVISAHADDKSGTARPSESRIAALCGFWRTARKSELERANSAGKVPDHWLVSKVIKNLIKLGYLEVHKHPGFNRVNMYTLKFPKLDYGLTTYSDFFDSASLRSPPPVKEISEDSFYTDENGSMLTREEVLDAAYHFNTHQIAPYFSLDAALSFFSTTLEKASKEYTASATNHMS